MKRLILVSSIALTVLFTGPAMADVGSGLIGNTVTLTMADGTITRIFYSDASTLTVRLADGTETQGSWRVDADRICTTVGNAPENCTAPITEPPVAGSNGEITGDQGTVKWAVSPGKSF